MSLGKIFFSSSSIIEKVVGALRIHFSTPLAHILLRAPLGSLSPPPLLLKRLDGLLNKLCMLPFAILGQSLRH